MTTRSAQMRRAGNFPGQAVTDEIRIGNLGCVPSCAVIGFGLAFLGLGVAILELAAPTKG
jgi:hypothetical protein